MSLTIGALITSFKTAPHSRYRRLSYKVRLDRDRYLKRIERDYGDCLLASIDSRTLTTWYNQWTEGGKLAVGKALLGQLRALFTHGVLLEDSLTSDSLRLYELIKRKRLKPIQPRTTKITSEQVCAIRSKAKEIGWFSIALAQALQFELLMRQKDVIGEWVPLQEPGLSDVTSGEEKWTTGIRWSEIDDKLILRHPTSTREKEIVCDLKLAPMVMDELKAWPHYMRTEDGPLVICEATALPWSTALFRRKWRAVADLAGVPKEIKNMDSCAGAKMVRIGARAYRDFKRPR